MAHPFDPKQWYVPERDGDLAKYLSKHDGTGVYSLFLGYEWFERLRDEEYLVPRMSIIRIMWNIGRGDEHFLVTEDFKLQGMSVPHHEGQPGLHEHKKLLKKKGPPWEAQDLNLRKIFEDVLKGKK